MQNVIIVQINYGKYSDCLEMKTFLILSHDSSFSIQKKLFNNLKSNHYI
jgi:hypothetical protein